MAGLDQQKDDPDDDDHEWAKDGATAHSAHLVAVGPLLGPEHIALGAGLLLHHPALVLPVLAAGRAGRWIRWGVVCHLDQRPSWSCVLEGTIDVEGGPWGGAG